MSSFYWYCCQCKNGGYNVSLVTVCPERGCGHSRCTWCTTESHETPYSYSQDGAGTSSPSSLLRHSSHGLVSQPSPTSLASASFQLSGGANHSTSTVTLPNSAANSPVLRAITSTSLAPEYVIPHHGILVQTAGPSDGEEYYWQCCYCQRGFMNYTLETGCNVCHNHDRCRYCPIQVVKR